GRFSAEVPRMARRSLTWKPREDTRQSVRTDRKRAGTRGAAPVRPPSGQRRQRIDPEIADVSYTEMPPPRSQHSRRDTVDIGRHYGNGAARRQQPTAAAQQVQRSGDVLDEINKRDQIKGLARQLRMRQGPAKQLHPAAVRSRNEACAGLDSLCQKPTIAGMLDEQSDCGSNIEQAAGAGRLAQKALQEPLHLFASARAGDLVLGV